MLYIKLDVSCTVVLDLDQEQVCLVGPSAVFYSMSRSAQAQMHAAAACCTPLHMLQLLLSDTVLEIEHRPPSDNKGHMDARHTTSAALWSCQQLCTQPAPCAIWLTHVPTYEQQAGTRRKRRIVHSAGIYRQAYNAKAVALCVTEHYM